MQCFSGSVSLARRLQSLSAVLSMKKFAAGPGEGSLRGW